MIKFPKTVHRIIIGDSRRMHEVEANSIHLIITSPPYFNAPFDYKDMFKDYDEFLSLIRDSASEMHRVLQEGRIACIVCDDMLVKENNGKSRKYPIVADITEIFTVEAGFRYRDIIKWRKPNGYIRRSRRSGSVIQNPFPMNFYPDNVVESILIFQKGVFNRKEISDEIRELSRIETSPMSEFMTEMWYLNVWDITNVLPTHRTKEFEELEKSVAAFPDEIPYRLINLYSYVGETVLDPFLGSGTTSKVAKELGRNSIGYEINPKLIPLIKHNIKQHLKKKQISLLNSELLPHEQEVEYEMKIITRRQQTLVLE